MFRRLTAARWWASSAFAATSVREAHGDFPVVWRHPRPAAREPLTFRKSWLIATNTATSCCCGKCNLSGYALENRDGDPDARHLTRDLRTSAGVLAKATVQSRHGAAADETGFIFEKKGQSWRQLRTGRATSSGAYWTAPVIPVQKRLGPEAWPLLTVVRLAGGQPEDNVINCRSSFWTHPRRAGLGSADLVALCVPANRRENCTGKCWSRIAWCWKARRRTPAIAKVNFQYRARRRPSRLAAADAKAAKELAGRAESSSRKRPDERYCTNRQTYRDFAGAARGPGLPLLAKACAGAGRWRQ